MNSGITSQTDPINEPQLKEIAILFPYFAGGGAEAVAVWMCQALKDKFRVHLVTLIPINLVQLNEFYGTSLNEGDILIHAAPPKISRRLGARSSFISLRQHVLIRYYKSLHLPPHTPISAFSEMDFGISGIMYIHYPLFGTGLAKARAAGDFPDSPLRRAYRNLLNRVFGFSHNRMCKNLMLTNSAWTARVIESAYSTAVQVLPPPVLLRAEPKPWCDRKCAVITIARMEPDKELHNIIFTVKGIREKGIDLKLTIISCRSDNKDYQNKILELSRNYSEWVTIKTNLDRFAMEEEMVNHQFGMHGKLLEHFGIAVAELVKAGCITFAPNDGGPKEILGNNPNLLFSNWQEAQDKILTVINDESLQQSLHRHIHERGQLYGEKIFCEEFSKIVLEFNS